MSERCWWATTPLLAAYHDHEWGVPVHDERHLFELVVLEGAQAGLSWSTILAKRDAYRAAFAGFAVEAVAGFDDADMARLLADAGIVRNRAKLAAAVGNARAVLAHRDAGGSLHDLLWDFVDGAPVQNGWRTKEDVPAFTRTSTAMSKDLVRRGFRFVGPTICYALMQSAGLVNDHLTSCPRHAELGGGAAD